MDIIARLDAARARINVLEHPFYERWNAGELTHEEIHFYAGEYRHAVMALADASHAAAASATTAHRAGLARHAEEESSHVELWDDFLGALSTEDRTGSLDTEVPRRPLTETRDCVRAWTSGESLLQHLAILYTIEASQPAISTTKIAGLTTHYGFGEDSPGLDYFRLHSTLDIDHADQAARLIRELAGEADAESMLISADAALAGNWRLLDGVEARSPVAV
jgi:pyrroloquinoline-quinone synthase